MALQKAWFTCAPIRFRGGEAFFARDSGLLSRSFAELGVKSKAVLPGPPVESEISEDLIRTDYRNLEDFGWWKQHQLTGVVLYAWGSPKYTGIARAIKDAGIQLITSIDSSGLMSPYTATPDYIRLLYSMRFARQGVIRGALGATGSLIRSFFPRFFDKARLDHLRLADHVTMVTPQGAELLRSLARRFGYEDVAEKIRYIPHPQQTFFRFDGTAKENLVVTVGRWQKPDWFQKNPDLLLAAACRFLKARPNYRYQIIGNSVEELQPLIERHGVAVRNRIELIPFVKPTELRKVYSKAKIGFWASRHEGQQGTGAQALCCGASVVATSGVAMNCFAHYTSRSSGRQAIRNTPSFLADALTMEAEAWDRGERDPEAISSSWCREFHAPEVARQILSLTC